MTLLPGPSSAERPGTVTFRVERAESRFVAPRGGAGETSVALEVRFDPLTGDTAHVAHFGAVEPQPLPWDAYDDPAVKGFCPFCPGALGRVTPRFEPHLFPEGCPEGGQARLVPNLYPYDAHGAVCVLTRGHVVRPGDLTERVLSDGLELGFRFWERVRRNHPEAATPWMGWNYMPPSGGGLVHPHLQFFRGTHPGNRHRRMVVAGRRFRAEAGKPLVPAYLAAERDSGERYLGRTGSWHWLSAFAPVGILGEIVGVCPGVHDADGFDAGCRADLIAGILKVIGFFADQGIESWNAGLFLSPDGDDALDAWFRFVPRTFLNLRDHAPDPNFFQSVFDEPVSVVRPEDLARRARRHFGFPRRGAP